MNRLVELNRGSFTRVEAAIYESLSAQAVSEITTVPLTPRPDELDPHG